MICSAVPCDYLIMTDEPLDSPHERLAWAREQAGFSDKAEFARLVSVNPTTYRAYEAGQNGFAKYAATFARRLGVSAEWLLEGGALPNIQPKGVKLRPDQPPVMDASASDPTVELSSLDLSYSMGPGTELTNYVEEEPIRFDPVFLRRISRAPWQRLKLARGVGDSMQPTLFPGDVVMIDTTQNMLNMQDRVYALAVNGAAAIKRLRIEKGGRILIVSDNPTVENYVVDAEEVTIHGRVVWFGREL